MPKYSIIRPLQENSEFFAQTCNSTFLLYHIEECEIIFTADETVDPKVIEIVKVICAQYPHISAKIIIDSDKYAQNPKLNNLYKGWKVAQGIWILMIDSNILLPRDTLWRFSSVWNITTGLVCSPPIGTHPDNFWAQVECTFLNTFQAKWQKLANFFNYGFAQGKVMFCHKHLLESLGGLLALDIEACEDAAATKLIRQENLQVHLVKKLFHQPLGHRSFSIIWQRQVRWARLRRITFPHWYTIEILASAMPFLVSLVIFPANYFMILVSWGATYLGEIVLAKMSNWPLSWQSPFAMLIRDFLMIGIYFAGWWGKTFKWGKKQLTLERKTQ